jgi:hypothetical protein
MTEYKVPVMHSVDRSRLRHISYASLSLINDNVYVIIDDTVHYGDVSNCNIKDLPNLLDDEINYKEYFKKNISNTRVVRDDYAKYYIEHLICNNLDSVIDLALNPVASNRNEIILILERIYIKF